MIKAGGKVGGAEVDDDLLYNSSPSWESWLVDEVPATTTSRMEAPAEVSRSHYNTLQSQYFRQSLFEEGSNNDSNDDESISSSSSEESISTLALCEEIEQGILNRRRNRNGRQTGLRDDDDDDDVVVGGGGESTQSSSDDDDESISALSLLEELEEGRRREGQQGQQLSHGNRTPRRGRRPRTTSQQDGDNNNNDDDINPAGRTIRRNLSALSLEGFDDDEDDIKKGQKYNTTAEEGTAPAFRKWASLSLSEIYKHYPPATRAPPEKRSVGRHFSTMTASTFASSSDTASSYDSSKETDDGSSTNCFNGNGDDHLDHTCTSDTVSDTQATNDTSSEPWKPETGNQALIHTYFKAWTGCSILLFAIHCANTNWIMLFQNEPWWAIMLAMIFFLIQGILQWSVMELPLMSLVSAIVKPQPDKEADGSHLSVIINYNLLASYKSEVDATLTNAFEAYIGNLSPSVVQVLVSATGDEELKAYELEVRDNLRRQIHDIVTEEGKAWAAGNVLDPGRAKRVFEQYRYGHSGEIHEGFVDSILPVLARKYAKDFMLIQRTTRVLRKCGQYQDLMLLSEGDNLAWTYTCEKHYNEAARKYGEPLFTPSPDVDNIQGRAFDYTLVLDGDTGVVKDTLCHLMNVAAANPNQAILQPSIKIVADEDQPLFMHIDKMRHEVYEPITAAVTTLLGRSGFYGKGLIKNNLYIRGVLGTREEPIEKVPIDVLSHDTFEAGALSPMYVSSVHLLEEPCGNYVTWDIRECRWNRGELLLSHYFFPKTLGRFFHWAMTVVRSKPPTKIHVRSPSHLDSAGGYIAHASLRQMFLKPTLLFYIICRIWIKAYFYYAWLPLILTAFLVLVFPKIPLIRKDNWISIMVEIPCSILQYSAEPITGTFRFLRSAHAHISGVSGWVPQFKVEQDFLIKPAVVATFAYQWKLFLLSCACLAIIVVYRPQDLLLLFLFCVTAFLPFYTTLTALPYRFWRRVARNMKYVFCCGWCRRSSSNNSRRGLWCRSAFRRRAQLPHFRRHSKAVKAV